MAYQAVSITLPKDVVVVLYIGFQLGTFYSQEYSLGYQSTDPKVEVQCPGSLPIQPCGRSHCKFRHIITTLLATARLQGYPQANVPLDPGTAVNW